MQKNKAERHKCGFFCVYLSLDSATVRWKPTKGYTNY